MQIDIFDDQYQHLGTADKDEVHTKGLWHRVFSCLIVTPRDTVFWQKKHSGLYEFDRPDYVEPVSAGGHYHAGESIEDGVREIDEELGLEVSYRDLFPLGIRQTAATISPNYIEREFQHLHLLPSDLLLEDFQLGNAETSGLVELRISDGIALLQESVSEIPARHLNWKRDAAKGNIKDILLTSRDLAPGYIGTDRLYLRLLIAARRYNAGERECLFW
jgi:isopentenyldiphosphate isomerase